MTARILVVDDVEANVRLLEAKLTLEYYEVLTAGDGSRALQVAQDERVLLAVIDRRRVERANAREQRPRCRNIRWILPVGASRIERVHPVVVAQREAEGEGGACGTRGGEHKTWGRASGGTKRQ